MAIWCIQADHRIDLQWIQKCSRTKLNLSNIIVNISTSSWWNELIQIFLIFHSYSFSWAVRLMFQFYLNILNVLYTCSQLYTAQAINSFNGKLENDKLYAFLFFMNSSFHYYILSFVADQAQINFCVYTQNQTQLLSIQSMAMDLRFVLDFIIEKRG